MRFDLEAAESFMVGHARLLDRHRLDVLLGKADPLQLLPALAAYRNPDGGYGWGLEPDLRCPESQPVGAMLALEVLVAARPTRRPVLEQLFGWLQSRTLPDGGLPFALPMADQTGCPPHWVAADPTLSSLQMTSQVAAQAHLLGLQLPEIAAHPWLASATDYCFTAIRALEDTPHAYELKFALEFLDALAEQVPEAAVLLADLGRFLSPDGTMPVAGGAEGETLYVLDFAPIPGRPVRALVSDEAVIADLDRLAALQQPDGGWTVDFDSASPAAALEWRGYATVHAIAILVGATP